MPQEWPKEIAKRPKKKSRSRYAVRGVNSIMTLIIVIALVPYRRADIILRLAVIKINHL